MGKVIQGRVLSRPPFIDIQPDKIIEAGDQNNWDLAELKYDGIWGQLVREGDKLRIYSRHGQLKFERLLQGSGLALSTEVVIHGEFMFGTNWADRSGLQGKFRAFDISGGTGKVSINREPLDVRRHILRDAVGALREGGNGDILSTVNVEPIAAGPHMWKNAVLAGGFEGLILKSSRGTFGAAWGRVKRVFEIDYVCLGFNKSGAAKYKGRMVSSVQAGLIDKVGRIVHAGNISGLNESQRTEMFNDPDKFIGRVLTASGKYVFDGGALRHPNFVRWHPTKKSEECTVAAARKVGGLQ